MNKKITIPNVDTEKLKEQIKLLYELLGNRGVNAEAIALSEVLEMLSFREEIEPVTNTKCPDCGSTDLEGGHVEITQDGAKQECQCNECGTDWEDLYTITNQNR